MPMDGLSLFGFLSQNEGVSYLQNACMFSPPLDQAALEAEWRKANAQLGQPAARQGRPSISSIDAKYDHYIKTLEAAWVPIFAEGWEVKSVEIEPLLAFQFHIVFPRCDHAKTKLSKPPTMDELLTLCLPSTPESVEARLSVQHQSAVISSSSLNLRIQQQGLLPGGPIGIGVGPGSPLTQVVRFNGRCYLRNGFHRSFAVATAGATHLPCIFKEMNSAAEVGIVDGGTFSQGVLESANPPTVGHFTQGRAYPLSVRALRRIIQITWAEHAVSDD